MVWFQCEDCGENLKKPKLQNHFRICGASKLSCIDCGVIFNQQSVQAHTQCVSEMEKYGPKGEGKVIPNFSTPKKFSTNQDSNIDLTVGLSIHPPWSCSLCNVKTTSKETLLVHSEGKKHRSKAKGFHASKSANQTEETCSRRDDKDLEQNVTENLSVEKQNNLTNGHDIQNLNSSKKRKIKEVESDLFNEKHKKSIDNSVKTRKCYNQCDKMTNVKHQDMETGSDEHEKQSRKKLIKWKKIIASVLKQSPEGTLSLKKLKKAVIPLIMEKLENADKRMVKDEIIKKVTTSSRFVVKDKIVQLA